MILVILAGLTRCNLAASLVCGADANLVVRFVVSQDANFVWFVVRMSETVEQQLGFSVLRESA